MNNACECAYGLFLVRCIRQTSLLRHFRIFIFCISLINTYEHNANEEDENEMKKGEKRREKME